jgi:hypothetical protein
MANTLNNQIAEHKMTDTKIIKWLSTKILKWLTQK